MLNVSSDNFIGLPNNLQDYVVVALTKANTKIMAEKIVKVRPQYKNALL